jgi:hypothetical protein
MERYRSMEIILFPAPVFLLNDIRSDETFGFVRITIRSKLACFFLPLKSFGNNSMSVSLDVAKVSQRLLEMSDALNRVLLFLHLPKVPQWRSGGINSIAFVY